jgi:sialic acid synthase SpsE
MAMVDAARRAGADAVKFQTFTTDKVIGPTATTAEYQRQATGKLSQRDMVRPLEMSDDLHARLAERARTIGIEFMSTPFDEDAVDMLLGLGMRRIKVPSGEITNHSFLRYVASKDVPLIISTGMATMEEVREAVSVVNAVREEAVFRAPLGEMVTILHCTSNYPAAYEDVNLRAMTTIAQELNLPVGYSDHTLGVAASTAAVALGARVIEKHFTLDKTMSGPDHAASLDLDELGRLVEQIRAVEACLGSPIKAPTESELPVRSLVRRSVTARRDLLAGETLTAADLQLLRPGTGIQANEYDAVLGRVLVSDVKAGTPLQWADVAE